MRLTSSFAAEIGEKKGSAYEVDDKTVYLIGALLVGPSSTARGDARHRLE